MARWLTVKEAATVLDLTPDAVRKRIKRGQLQVRTQDGLQRVLIEDERILSSAVGKEASEATSALVDALRAQIEDLREQNRRLFDQWEEANEDKRRQTAIIDRLLMLPAGQTTAPQPAPPHEDPAPVADPAPPMPESKPRPWWQFWR